MNVDRITETYRNEFANMKGIAIVHGVREPDAEDIAQDAMVRLWEKEEKGEINWDGNIHDWLSTTVTHLCIDLHRRPFQRDILFADMPTGIDPDDDNESIGILDQIPLTYSLEDRAIARTQLAEVLPYVPSRRVSQQGELYSPLGYFKKIADGYSFPEISRMFNTPLGTIKTRIRRERMMINERLEAG